MSDFDMRIEITPGEIGIREVHIKALTEQAAIDLEMEYPGMQKLLERRPPDEDQDA